MADMSFRGHKATVVIELEMRDGAVLRVPVGDLASYQQEGLSSPYGKLTIPIGRPLMERMWAAEREARRDFNV